MSNRYATTTPDAGPSQASLPEVFDALSRQRRIAALDCLRRRGEETLDGLAVRVARTESDDATVDGAHLARVRAALHHNHLPRLADVGLVAYDEADLHARVLPLPDAVHRCLDDALDEQTDADFRQTVLG